jgi:hypothetical protein
MVARIKTEPGGIYLHAPTQPQDAGQDYEYHIITTWESEGFKLQPAALTVKVFDVYASKGEFKLLFEGDVKAFIKFCNKPEKE